MKIAIYANLQPEGGAGGAPAYTAALIKALGTLSDGDEEYIVLAPTTNDEWLRNLAGPNQQVIPLPASTRQPGARSLRRFARAIGEYVRPASGLRNLVENGYTRLPTREGIGEMVPASNGFIESLGVSMIHFPFQEFVLTSLPSVYNPHDLQHLHLPQFFSPDTLLAREICYRFACNVATRVVVASDWIAEDICTKYSVPRNKVAVIPWGAATFAESAPSDIQVAKIQGQHRLPDSFLFYPATMWAHKNHLVLVEALAILKRRGRGLGLVLTGGITSQTEALQQRAREMGVLESIRILGVVPANELRAIYRLSTAVLIPTLFEAVSGPIAEAWQENIPVVCSDIPQLRRQAEGAALFFDPYSAESIADAVERLLSSQTLAQQIVEEGRRKLADLDWTATARQYREVYRQAASFNRAAYQGFRS